MDEPKEHSAAEAKDASPSFLRHALMRESRLGKWADRILIGPEGLRAGWRFLLYCGLARTLYLVLGAVLFYQDAVLGLWLQLTAQLGLLVIVALPPAFLMAAIEGTSVGTYGLPRRGAFGKSFWLGALWGMGALSILMLMMYIAGLFDPGRLALHGLRIVKFAAFWGVFYLLVGLYEEFLTRGYTQFTLTRVFGFWPSAVLMSVFFGGIHLSNPGESWIGILGASAIGFFFCLTLRRTGNLWFAVGFHAAWDWGESYFYSVPDSGGMSPGHLLHSSFHGRDWLTGGSAGPEGSVLVFLLLAVLWVAFDRVYPEVKYDPPKEIADSGLQTSRL